MTTQSTYREDYYNGSCGTFQPVCAAWVGRILKGTTLIRTEEMDIDGCVRASGKVKSLPQKVRLGNHDWTINFVSVNGYFGSVSIYYRSGDYLLRISDHWSESNLSVKQCGNIRSCYWRLKGMTHQFSRLNGSDNKFQGGIIKMSDLEYL